MTKPSNIAPLNIAVVGAGISGLSAAWLLGRNHAVTLYEREDRLGGHSHTVNVDSAQGPMAVDTGFLVYNEHTYPNLTALFEFLSVPTQASDMSFGISLGNGAMEYAGTNLAGLFGQKSNLARPRFWRMLRDLVRFYREAGALVARPGNQSLTLGGLLDAGGFGQDFIEWHLLPMAASIWSAPISVLRDHPASEFIKFCDNHGLLKLGARPQWRTVTGGSRSYVQRIAEDFAGKICLNSGVRSINRTPGQVQVEDRSGQVDSYDHVVVAAHADEALSLLTAPSAEEQALLGAFRYQPNQAILHRDQGLMPRRRAVWSSWNYIGAGAPGGDEGCCVTYWLNRLRALPDPTPIFVTLNPDREPRAGTVARSFTYDHPIFDTATARAQPDLWRLQGRMNTWYCGAYFGAGFHEDGLQAGLAVAEALGGAERPWQVAEPSGRIHVGLREPA